MDPLVAPPPAAEPNAQPQPHRYAQLMDDRRQQATDGATAPPSKPNPVPVLEAGKDSGVGSPAPPVPPMLRMQVTATIGCWFCASVGVTYMFKYLLSTRGLRAPFFLVGVTNVLVSALALLLSRVPPLRPPAVTLSRFVRVVLPIGIGTTLDISFSNWSLSFVSVAYHVVLKGTVPLFVLAFSLLLRLERARGFVTPLAVVVIVLGITLASLDPDETDGTAADLDELDAENERPFRRLRQLQRLLAASTSEEERADSARTNTAGEDPNRPLGLFLGLLSSCFAGQRWAFTQLLMRGRNGRAGDGTSGGEDGVGGDGGVSGGGSGGGDDRGCDTAGGTGGASGLSGRATVAPSAAPPVSLKCACCA